MAKRMKAGSVINGYILTHFIGKGNWSYVWRAQHLIDDDHDDEDGNDSNKRQQMSIKIVSDRRILGDEKYLEY